METIGWLKPHHVNACHKLVEPLVGFCLAPIYVVGAVVVGVPKINPMMLTASATVLTVNDR